MKPDARRIGRIPPISYSFVAVTAIALILFLSIGCEKEIGEILVPNIRPIVELSIAPQPEDSVLYAVRFEWFARDQDGEVIHVIYAVDPPATGDTAWVRTDLGEITLFFKSDEPPDPLPPAGTVPSSRYHVFVIKAVDNDGATSEPVFRAFTSYTVAPQTQIEFPKPSRLLVTITHPSLTIRWSGVDPDGVTRDEPVLYKYRIVTKRAIQDSLGLGEIEPFPKEIQEYFGASAPGFADWDSVPPDSAYRTFESLTPGQTWFFAVAAFDEAGAYEPRFLLGHNVLSFQPTTNVSPPTLTVFNAFFRYEQPTGSFSVDEESVIRLDYIAGEPITFEWFAKVITQGTEVRGYRWVLDPPDQDIFDETPREHEGQTWRWSSWSLYEKSATLGPFETEPGKPGSYRFYVEARDNGGLVTIVILEIRVLALSGTADKPILIFDDFHGSPDLIVNDNPDDPASFQPHGDFPTEAVLDTLLYAVGGKPYQHRPLGTLSEPGMFAGFDYDTLDYRFGGVTGIPLELLLRYEAVIIYTGFADAGRQEGLRNSPKTSALRYINTPGRINSLALYLLDGGKVWIFGHGGVRAIFKGALGQSSRYPVSPGQVPFLYDYMKAHSIIAEGEDERGGSAGIVGATPYLPDYITPGRPWPLGDWYGRRGPQDEPRIGPSSVRLLPHWEDLPFLSLTDDFTDWPRPLPRRLASIAYLGGPNEIVEDYDPGPGEDTHSTLDTLYLYRTMSYYVGGWPPNGYPVMLSYWGEDHGPMVWCGLPLWHFDREQLRQLAEVVLRNLGYHRSPSPEMWTGPGSAHRHLTDVELRSQ